MATHSEATRNVHEPLERDEPGVISQISRLIAQRPADEPHPLFGVIILAGCLGLLAIMVTGFCIMTGGL